MNKYIVTIVPIGKVIAANQDADKVNRGKTGKTFTVPLWPIGADTQKTLPTHAWFCWLVNDDEEKQIREDFDPTDPANPEDKHQSKIYILDKPLTREKILEENRLKTMDADKAIGENHYASRI